MKYLENYIERIKLTETIDDAFAAFSDIMLDYGYDRLVYTLITDHPSLNLEKQPGLATSYPDDWIKHYTEQHYLKDDPVVLAMLKSGTPFFWDDLHQDPTMSDYSLDILNQGSDAGVKDGIGLPMFGKPGEIVGIGLTKNISDKKRDYQFLAGAYLLSSFFHQKFRQLLVKDTVDNLTKREISILSWAAEGKTDDEISEILTLSVNTVRYHWKNIFKKLGANGKMYAVSKALTLGLVTPNFIINPIEVE